MKYNVLMDYDDIKSRGNTNISQQTSIKMLEILQKHKREADMIDKKYGVC